MPIPLREALRETLEGWEGDLDPAWRPVLGDVALGFDAVDPALALEPWEPIFPARRGRIFPGAPAGAHMLRAFDGLDPDAVCVVILGQDPYPSPDFATGRAFEAGSVARWRELDKMFSVSVRTFMQQVCAARTGRADYARDTAEWPRLLADIEAGLVPLESPDRLLDPWASQGVLAINSSLTLSRFAVAVDPHQSRGHLPLWRPLMLRLLRHLAGRADHPCVFIGYGRVATDTLRAAGKLGDRAMVIAREHPAAGNAVLAAPNPFLLANEFLREHGHAPIAW